MEAVSLSNSLTHDPEMHNSKHPSAPTVFAQPEFAEEAYTALATANDRNDMQRMGKQQVFKRNFGFWPTLGFTSIYIATWEYLLVSVYAGLVNGGFGGLVYEYIATAIFYMSIVLSLAEMASMAPTSGGQYHWVSEFAPPELQKYLSYAAGWLLALGWLVGATSGYYITATLVEAVTQVYMPNFAFANWQATLVMLGFICIFVFINTFGSRVLPMLENITLFGHWVGWLITVITLLVMCPKNSAHDVFSEVIDGGGWSNTGLSCMVGSVSILFCSLGPDAAVHIAEEVHDAALTLPRCIVWGYVTNVVAGFGMLLTILFTIGDLDNALNADAPFQASFANTGSQGMNTFLTLILLLLIGAGNVVSVTTTSREAWAFARDGGLPFSRFMARVSRRYNAPLNAIWVTTILAFILCLINIGSTEAFNIIISLNLVAFLSSYILAIACVMRKKILGLPLPPARWSLGRLGIPINGIAVAYSLLTLILSCFPVMVPVNAGNANWAPAIFGGVILIAVISYGVQGRKIYEGPVVFVEGIRKEGVGLQESG